MGCHYNGSPLQVNTFKDLHNFPRNFWVQVPCWFIRNQNFWIIYNSTRNSNTLLLTTRQLIWERTHLVFKTNQLEYFCHSFLDMTRFLTNNFHGISNIFKSCFLWKEFIILENNSNGTSQEWNIFLTKSG